MADIDKYMNVKEKSARIRTLMKDDTFQDVVSEIIERQVSVFLDPNSSTEERDDAHDIVRAIEKVKAYMESVIADEVIHNRKQKRK